MYKTVEIDDNIPPKSSKKNKKIIICENIFHTIVSTSLIVYYTINLGINSYIAKKYNFNLNGLVKGYSFLGGYRDFSDYQWRYYRENLSLIITFALVFVIISKIIKTFCSINIVKSYYLLF